MLVEAVNKISSPELRNASTLGGDLLQEVWCQYLRGGYSCWRNGGYLCYGAIGDNSYASAQNGAFDFAFADGTNSFAEAEIGNFDVAVADGADSVAKAGFYAEPISGLFSPTNFDAALVFGDGSTAFAGFEGIDNSVGFFDLAAAFGDNLLAQAIVAPFLVDIVQ